MHVVAIRVRVVVRAGVAVDMLILILECLEVSHDLPSAEGLAVAVVAEAKVLHPDALESVQVLGSDGQHLLV